jgi:hypothetical protein
MKRTTIPVMATTLSLMMAASVTASSAEVLYNALLKATPSNLPSGFSSATPTAVPQNFPGLIGEVDLVFHGGDPKARLGFFVFNDFNAASEFNRKQLPPFIRGQKLLAFPPMARCINAPNGTGYCDMWIQDRNVIMTAAASKIEGGADALMAFGFRYLNSISVSRNAASGPMAVANPGEIAACSLLTQDEVESALRQRVASPEPDKAGGCSWRGSSAGAVTVQVFETGQNGFNNAKRRSLRSTPLPEIADDAFGFVSLASFVQIQLIKNGHFVALTLESQRDPAKLETAKALATKIAARL